MFSTFITEGQCKKRHLLDTSDATNKKSKIKGKQGTKNISNFEFQIKADTERGLGNLGVNERSKIG